LVLLGLLTRARAALAAPPGERAETRPVAERLFDCLLAASIASWAIAGLSGAPRPVPLVRVSIAVLHVAVAVLLLRRSRARLCPAWSTTALCLPAFLISGLALTVGAPLDQWSLAAQLVFLSGTMLTVRAFAALGRSFAFFPAVRSVSDRGPYRWVRHPAYAGELLMLTACLFSRPTPLGLGVIALALPLVWLRIRAEEELLLGIEEYRAYAARVTARLVPGIW
jgi:protein-S-isoprenylcysteine O-methyltransferase Ste14